MEEKWEKLREWFAENPKVLIGFSGGVDSAFLLAAAKECGAEALPVFIKTPFQPDFELRDAEQLAASLGIKPEVLTADPLSDPEIMANGPERCYYCKRMLFSMLRRLADERGEALIDGTNASDPEDDRPGMRALRELGAQSPLRIAGFIKADIRAESKKRGLFTWDKPSYACLATRVPTRHAAGRGNPPGRWRGRRTPSFRLGYKDFRVRVFHGAARVQLLKEDWPDEGKRGAILAAVRPYFDTVLLDMALRQVAGMRGAGEMNTRRNPGKGEKR